MEIPEKTLQIIIKVCDRSKNKFKIDGMSGDDIFQESFLICVKALEKYDGIRPLENFLAFVLANGIKNIYRRVNNNKIDCVPIDTVPEEYLCVEDKVGIQDIISIINEKLSVNVRHDYIKYIHGVFIPHIRRIKLIEEIRRHVDESAS